MKSATGILVTFTLMLMLSSACTGNSQPERVQADILRETQELFDAVAPGNKGPWEKVISDDVMYFDEQGHNMDKNALLATIAPLPPGVSGSIRVVRSKFNLQGKILIHSYDVEESENVHGQELHARYHATDTWMNRSRRWQIVAGQVLRYYEDPAEGVADVKRFSDYAGTYKLGTQQEVVSFDGAKLYLTRDTRPRTELVPEACDIFFRKGVEGRILFRYSSGRVTALIDRRNNEDIVWEKIGATSKQTKAKS